MDEWKIFGENEDGRPGSFEEILELTKHFVEEHDMPPYEAMGYIIDMVRPGHSDNSHDVRPIFVGAMYALGFGELSEKFGSVFVNTMPWGVGFCIGVDHDFDFHATSPEGRQAVMRSLCVILESGGMNVSLDGEQHILMQMGDDGPSTKLNIDDIVAGFRRSMDDELGETPEPRLKWKDKAIDPEDPIRKWII